MPSRYRGPPRLPKQNVVGAGRTVPPGFPAGRRQGICLCLVSFSFFARPLILAVTDANVLYVQCRLNELDTVQSSFDASFARAK